VTSGDETAAFFDAIAERYDREYARGSAELRESLGRVVGLLTPRSHLLDLGVGTGRELPALLDAGHSVVGLDISPAMLALCQGRARPIPVVLGDLWRRLPFDDASFDAVVALFGTLSHAPSAEARAALPFEVARVLRPGGVFVAEVPTSAWLDEAGAFDTDRVERLSSGEGRFVDTRSKKAVTVSLLPAEAWKQLFSTALAVRMEGSPEGEVTIIGTRAGRHPGQTRVA
jgi:SAM-dependent methyltransferase